MALSHLNRETILEEVERWPVNEQMALAEAILANVRTKEQGEPITPSDTIRGIFSNGQPAPSDEEVARIIEEERIKKYDL